MSDLKKLRRKWMVSMGGMEREKLRLKRSWERVNCELLDCIILIYSCYLFYFRL